jgi:selenocysteine lyase/cysteine desulfurase
MTAGGANLHGAFVTSRETENLIRETRHAVARFLGAEADEMAFGHNMTTLALAISRALGGSWDQDSEIVVTEIDHRANVDPWTLAAAGSRWHHATTQTLRTKLVAMPARLVHSARRLKLRAPTNWPWRGAFEAAMVRIAAIPAPT